MINQFFDQKKLFYNKDTTFGKFLTKYFIRRQKSKNVKKLKNTVMLCIFDEIYDYQLYRNTFIEIRLFFSIRFQLYAPNLRKSCNIRYG